MRRIAIGGVGVVVLGVVLIFVLGPSRLERSMNVVLPHSPHPVSAEAKRMHRGLVVADWHADSLLWRRDLLERGERGQVDVPRLLEGNVAIQMFTAVTRTPRGMTYEDNRAEGDNITLLVLLQRWPPRTWASLTERALYQAERLHGFAERAPDRLRVVGSAMELRQTLEARRPGKGPVAGLLGLEGAHSLDGEIANLDRLYEAGYRMIGLQHFFDNELGGSLHGLSHAGLSDFGREVVRRAEALGMIVDVAHSSPAVVDDVLELATRPLVVSHTGLYGVCPTARNLADEQMRRIAEAGGIVAVGYWDAAACDIEPAGVVAAIRYAIDLLGEDHVSLGSDYDGSVTTTFDTSELAALTHEMMKAGFSEAEIEKTMGGNAARFLLEQLPRGE
jgi:microsomal dipeptidase-like Zn-dependent dipeptidase